MESMGKYLLSGPPGWLGANVVRSYTLPFTTIQQSSGVACLSSSATETLESEDMMMVDAEWTRLVYNQNLLVLQHSTISKQEYPKTTIAITAGNKNADLQDEGRWSIASPRLRILAFEVFAEAGCFSTSLLTTSCSVLDMPYAGIGRLMAVCRSIFNVTCVRK